MRHVLEAMHGKRPAAERIAPVIRVAGDYRGQMSRLAKQRVFEQMPDLPVPFALRQAQVPVDQVKGPLGRIDDGDLRTAGLLGAQCGAKAGAAFSSASARAVDCRSRRS